MNISILPGGGPVIAEPLDRKRRPQNRVDAQFSVYFGAAFTIVCGTPEIGAFDGSYFQDPSIQHIADCVELFHDQDLDARYPRRWGCQVDIRLSDGSRRNVVVEDPRGDARCPRVADEVDAKFLSLAGPIDQELAQATLVMGS